MPENEETEPSAFDKAARRLFEELAKSEDAHPSLTDRLFSNLTQPMFAVFGVLWLVSLALDVVSFADYFISYYPLILGLIALIAKEILVGKLRSSKIALRFSNTVRSGVANGLGVSTSFEASKKAISDIQDYLLVIFLCLVISFSSAVSVSVNSLVPVWPFLTAAIILGVHKAVVIFRIRRGFYCNNSHELREFVQYLQEKSARGGGDFSGKALQDLKDVVRVEAEALADGGRTA